MAKHKLMRQRMLNWADWKVRQKDGIGRYARMRWEVPTDAESRMPWEADVVRPDEQDAWEIDKALRSIALPTELRATVECYYLDRRLTEREKLERLQVAKSTMFDRLDRVDYLVIRHLAARAPSPDQRGPGFYAPC